MLEKRKDIDAVMVATPDHMHAPIALAALRSGKHVYVEKPMAHSIEEARLLTQVAHDTGLVTQMGNNGHAGEGLRQTRESIRAGVIGAVRQVHGWSDRPGKWWKQPAELPAESHACPPRAWIGTSGWVGLLSDPTIKLIIRLPGAVGLISAPAHRATWRCTISIRPFMRLTWALPPRPRRNTPVWAKELTPPGQMHHLRVPGARRAARSDHDLV